MREVVIDRFVIRLSPPQLVDRNGATVCIRPKALSVLAYLARNANRTVLKEELHQAVWPNVVVTADSLVQCIREIRKAIQDDQRRILRTDSKRGYRLSAPGVAVSFDEDGSDFSQKIDYAYSKDGTRIAYAISGQGPTIVRAPHWMTHLELEWQDGISGTRVRALSKDFRLVRFDHRGTGLSDRNGPGTLADWYHDLAAVVRSARVDRFALLGISGGGVTCVRYATRHPDRVACLILHGALLRGGAHRGLSSEGLAALCTLVEEGWGRSDGAFRRLVINLIWPGADDAIVSTISRLQLASSDGMTAAQLIRALHASSVENDLPDLKVPAMLLNCTGDQGVPIAEAEFAARQIPNARLVKFNSIGHGPLPTDPEFDRYLDEIRAFVRAHAAPSK